jgi:hypothetical protein
MKDTLILKDESVIEMESGASLSDIRVLSDSKTAMAAVWDKLTEDNLAEVSVKNGDGITVGHYTDLLLASETSTVRMDGTILTSFNLREKNDMEKRLDAIEKGQQIQDAAIQTQDEAIGDLGQAVSDMMEGGV